ncbi:MAG: DUF1573 domain-containing protein, partial [Planctomycetota bacterium]
MRRPMHTLLVLSLWLAILPLAPAPLSAQTEEKYKGFGPPALPVGSSPRIRILEPLHDWGTVVQGTEIRHVFRIENHGEAPLKIHKVKSSCGCATARFEEEIAGGGSGELELLIDSSGLRGGHPRKNATIHSNDPLAPEFVVWLSGKILPLVKHEPKLIKLSGLAETPKELKVEITRGAEIPITIEQAVPKNNYVQVTALEEVEKGGRYLLTLKAPPHPKAATLREEVTLTVMREGAKALKIPLTVVVEHQNRIKISPGGNIFFYRRQTAHLRGPTPRPVTRELHVYGATPEVAFKVEAIRIEEAPEGIFSARLETLEEGRSYKITVSVDR